MGGRRGHRSSVILTCAVPGAATQHGLQPVGGALAQEWFQLPNLTCLQGPAYSAECIDAAAEAVEAGAQRPAVPAALRQVAWRLASE